MVGLACHPVDLPEGYHTQGGGAELALSLAEALGASAWQVPVLFGGRAPTLGVVRLRQVDGMAGKPWFGWVCCVCVWVGWGPP
ncbi:hypothetical protein GCM10010171_16120 [Actinokineospora fastidiosa]|uniref:Uncharacterized protein n=1 Tax=Actinokineospora fastidiosa TaxID=1816 RepID=A0A918GAM9_9PSEU|nr:hypothetical protein GCM10010171_16120 [Actinokineospora fastidiosa]